jgi:hypothetical protein
MRVSRMSAEQKRGDGAAGETAAARRGARRLRVVYALLTVALGGSQLWAFAAMRNLYPVAAWTQMMAGGDLDAGRDYLVLRGETVAGETVDIPAAQLTDALSKNSGGLAEGTLRNGGFRLRRPHPENAAMLAAAGGLDKLPRGARLPELLRAWGAIYNGRLPTTSPLRLRALRLDSYRWDGRRYADYDRFIESWRVEL